MRIVANERLSRQTLAARWRELSGDPNAPERWELDEFGELQVSPPRSYRHLRIVAALMRRIEATLGGEVGSYAIASAEGGRIPDLCWAPSFDELAREG